MTPPIPTDAIASIPGYVIVEQLYSGTHTVVYRGVEQASQRPVVIKLLRQEYPSFTDLLQFRNQYTITKNLNIPGIIVPYQLESWGNRYVLVMEDFGGISLRQYAQEHFLSIIEIVAIALQLAEVLHQLHQASVIHKDLKPANILIHPQTQQVKLIDFSIASLLPKETQEIKNPNGLEGTLSYLAPEQTGRMNRGIDYRADFYALGVTLFELLTQQLPFQSDDPMELVHCHLAKQPPEAHDVNAAVPRMLSAIVSKLMAKNAEDRYQSALGLKHDLHRCLQELTETGHIEPFELGTHDRCDRFLIPEKLYGRQAEVQGLLQAFDRVAQGRSEVMLVAGFSGIGKTAMIREVHKPIVRQHGYFIKGKFDQFNRNIPFSAFVQAFRDLVGQLLSESDAELLAWRQKIAQALGEHAQVIVDVIPELEHIIGVQPAAPELTGTAAQNRFNRLFQQFIQVFTAPEHPLVLVLDDLQWADSASLQLMQVMMSELHTGHLLLIGAYRDNEVFPAHPLTLTLSAIAKAGTTINTLELKPLAPESVLHLVADTLATTPAIAQPLAQLVYHKTQGNPFFATQFLKTLHHDRWITFDPVANHWECDITQVQAAFSDDVVQLMVHQLQKLPTATQTILKLAACIGNQFDLQTLSIVSEQPQTDVAIALWNALQEGLILPRGEQYKFYLETKSHANQDSSQPSFDRLSHHSSKHLSDQTVAAYKFLHDRVQQAAYSLIPDDQKQATHLAIGRLLLRSAVDVEANVFEIVNHWNIALDLVCDRTERDQLVQLNLLAGNKAKASAAAEPALQYFKMGLGLLDADGWTSQYDLALALHEGAAKTALICGDFQQMELWASLVLQHSKTTLSKVKIYDVQIQAQMAQAKPAIAIDIALAALKLLNIELSESPTSNDIQQELAKTQALWANRAIATLVDLPPMTDPEKVAALIILSSIFAPAFTTRPALLPLIACQQVQLSIHYGNCEQSAFGYANYSAILSTLCNDLEASYQFGQLAIHLVDKLNAKEVKARTFNQVAIFSMHGNVHTQEAPPILQEGCQSGLENGDLEFAGYAAYNWSQYSYFSGLNLMDLHQGSHAYELLLNQINQQISLSYNQLVQQVALNLLGEADDPTCLVGKAFNEDEALQTFLQNQVFSGVAYLFVHKLILSCLFSKFDHALEQIAWAERYLSASTGMIIVPVFHFIATLVRLQIYDTQPPDIQASLLPPIDQGLEEIRAWAVQAPMNFQHKFDVLMAERSRILGDRYMAAEQYDQAIAGAQAHGYVQDEALANELAGRFYLSWSKEKVAAGYLADAYTSYARWGAKAKTDEMEHRYSGWLPTIAPPSLSQLNPLETLAAVAPSIVLPNPTKTGRSSSSSSINATLDLAAVLKASQVISGTIQLDTLLHQLTQIVLQNSGGDRCALILPNLDGCWELRAIATPDSTELYTEPLEDYLHLPRKLLQYVKNTSTLVMVEHLQTDLPILDEYLTQCQPKSLLGLPILNQGQLIGLLYLENRSTSGVFTSDRLIILNFLCTQAAISLENARLYVLEQARTNQLQQSESRLKQLFDKAADAVMLLGNQGFIDCNQAAVDLFGATHKSQLCSIHPGQLSPEIQYEGRRSQVQANAMIAHALEKGSHQFEWIHQRFNGETFWAEVTLTSIPYEEETILHCVVRDISDRKAAEAAIHQKSQELEEALQHLQQAQLQMVQSEKMASLGNLVAGVAHEINNPVGFLNGSISNAKDYIHELLEHLALYQQHYPTAASAIEEHAETIDLSFLTQDLPKLLESMKGATTRIKSISTSLRTFSRADTEHKVLANLHEGIDSTLLILKYRLNANEYRPAIQIRQTYDNLPKVECFLGQLNQVFMNILANAIDMFDEMAQHMSLQELEANPQTITITTITLDEAKSVEIRIRDNGKGMSEEVKAKIFDHLFTTKGVGRGTGLGLAIAHQIVTETHAGHLTVESALGQGTEFCIRLPISG
ncbi:AAA family ATPase [Leptolyngbya sp. AN02str]|uniref:AAA family ATPase n=1 Tax=Leptolyngbya sp. AN02str TaxID=3423363 RepID=UPI003D31B960